MTEVRFAGIAELASLLRRGRLGAVELAKASLELLETDGERYHAVAAVTRKRALEEARLAQASIRRRPSGSQLRGIPYGVKDVIAARGAPTTWGAQPYADQVFDEDAAAVAQLRKAGAVLVAKLSTIALAGGGGYHRFANASLQGATLNPWDPSRWSGGSSSGPAAAVAGGLVPFALGTETSGSIGTPSSFCGVTGLRPTYELIDRRGTMALSWSLDKVGVMARSSEDCALALEPLSRGRFRRLDRRAANAAVRGIRIGYLESEVEGHAQPTTRGRVEAGVREFARIVSGHMRPAQLPPLPFGPMVGVIHNAEGATIFADLIESPALDTLTDERQKAGFRASLDVRARDYLQAQRFRTVLLAQMSSIFDEHDVLLTFGHGRTAPPIAEPRDGTDWWNAGLVAAGNLAGLPAIFFPCGRGTDGLPVGLQVVGPALSEPLLVALVDTYQRATDHHRRRPTVAA